MLKAHLGISYWKIMHNGCGVRPRRSRGCLPQPKDLIPCSENGTDSYVRLYLLPDQSWRHRMRTQVKKRKINPVFNEKFEFNVSQEEALTRKLDIAVKNNRMFHSRERKEIGMVLIDLANLDLTKGVTDWFELSLPGLKKSN